MWEQFQKKAHLYNSNVLLVPHGDDFRYTSQREWHEQFGNLNKLFEYINNDKDMNVQVITSSRLLNISFNIETIIALVCLF